MENDNVLLPKRQLRELHLFCGCGGGVLGGILLGHTTVCAVEIEPYCRKVLLQRQRDGILPKFPIWDDVRTFDGNPWFGIAEVVSGGFLCTDLSAARTNNRANGKQLALMAEALDCGAKWQELLARFNLELSVLKTHQTCELKDLSESSKTLMQWGIMRDGACSNVATSAQTISENGFASLLPTPTAHNSKEGAYPAEFTRNTPTLAAQIGGKINPDWNEWRMGCPTKWSDLGPLGTDKFLQWLRSHGKH